MTSLIFGFHRMTQKNLMRSIQVNRIFNKNTPCSIDLDEYCALRAKRYVKKIIIREKIKNTKVLQNRHEEKHLLT